MGPKPRASDKAKSPYDPKEMSQRKDRRRSAGIVLGLMFQFRQYTIGFVCLCLFQMGKSKTAWKIHKYNK